MILDQTVENIAGASTTLSDIDQITGNSLTSFIDSMMELVHQLWTHQISQVIFRTDFEYYIGKTSLFLLPEGQFKMVEGVSAEEPQKPKDLDNAMKQQLSLYHHIHSHQKMLKSKDLKLKDLQCKT